MSEPGHIPVMLREVVQHLELLPGMVVVDGTVGAGGHSRAILEQIGSSGRLIGLDRDAKMLQIAARALPASNAQLIHASYSQLPQVLEELHVPAVDRILLDLGLSSVQLADDERGFSFRSDGPLDLRFDISRGEPAWSWLERVDEPDLADVLFQYAEEPHSRALARHLVAWRSRRPIRTGRDLGEAVESARLVRKSGEGERHPATRVFQALRIIVNEELAQLETFLGQVVHACLKPDGIVAIISFQSLEDRLVKQALRDPKLWQASHRKPETPRTAELRANPRSRTAKLRVAKRI